MTGRILSACQEPPPGWRGTLTGIRDQALIFAGSGPHASTALFLMDAALPNTPGGLRVEWPDGSWLPSWLKSRVGPGLEIRRDLGAGCTGWTFANLPANLTSDAHTVRPGLTIAENAAFIPTTLASRPESWVAAATPCLAITQERMPPYEDLAFLAGFARSIVHRNGSAVSLESLVGRGQGSTPSGDDFLVAWLCALDLAAANGAPAIAARRHELEQAVSRRLDTTCLLSRHFLKSACGGSYCQPLLDMARELSMGQTIDAANPAWLALSAQGDSSGWAMLLGFSSGILHSMSRGGC